MIVTTTVPEPPMILGSRSAESLTTEVPTIRPSASLTAELTLPTRGLVLADTRRHALRILAPEREQLESRRGELVLAALDAPLAAAERSELSEIEWKIDRLEDAEEGEFLDQMERLEQRRELLSAEVASLVSALRSRAPSAFDRK